jgi:hypothetical protein
MPPDRTASPGMGATKSKNELYEEARDAGIAGRSAMNKGQLVEALRKHRGPREPATRQESGRRPRDGEPPRSQRRPAQSAADSAEVVRSSADPPEPDRCAIVYEGSGRYGEFHVVVTETDGSRRSVARSPAFRAPRLGRLRRRGRARDAHELLVSGLEACDWWPLDSEGPWYSVRFVRLRGEGMRRSRSLVTVIREAGQARFAAQELGSYGKPTPLMVSTPFDAPRFRGIRRSTQAMAALKQLVRRMESAGWQAPARVGENWYAISLWRPVGMDWRPPASRPSRRRRAAESG